LLADLVKGEPLSPTGFGLSVHNAIAAQYGISRNHMGNAVVVAGAQSTVAAAMVEASALLHDGADEVLVVNYEAPLPGDYSRFNDKYACEYAWAWRVGRVVHPEVLARVRISYAESDHTENEPCDGWPSGLKVLRHFLREMNHEGSTQEDLVCSERFGAQTRWGIRV